MTHRLRALSLSLVLLLAQQLGALHLLSHVLQPAATGHAHTPAQAQAPVQAQAQPDAAHGAQADAADALCQICLVLATLGAASLPVLWGWLVRQALAGAPRPPRHTAPARPAPAPYRARGPPVLPALH